jgi:hypothetical protein
MAYKTMTLSECAKYDHDNGLKNKLTGWGKVSKARELQKISRKQRRLIRDAK